MQADLEETVVRPWYREFWVWFFLAILGMGVASGSGILIIGINNAPQMVTGDYQPLGKALVDTRAHAQQAEHLGLSASLSVEGGVVELLMQANHIGDLPGQLLLRFQHPTDAARDLAIVARKSGPDRWQAAIEEIQPPARSRVILSDLQQTWWLRGRFDGEVAGQIGLDPGQP